jgi:uncharacterized membrane protein
MAENINHRHKDSLSFLDKIALYITTIVGTMYCAFVFAILAFVGFPFKGATPLQYVLWTSTIFLQLVLLPIIIVGQNLQNRHAQLLAEQMYRIEGHNEKLLEELNKLKNNQA